MSARFNRKSTLPVPPQAEKTSASTSNGPRNLACYWWAKPIPVFALDVGDIFSKNWLQIEGNKQRVTDFIKSEKQQLIINDFQVNPLVHKGEKFSLHNNQIKLKKDPKNQDILLLEIVIKVNSISNASKHAMLYEEQLEISINTDSKIPES
jgi:hypothetical protein